MDRTEFTLDVPFALQKLIKSNNTLLKTYQAQLMQEIQEANVQMMSILQLNPEAGWVLDMDRMVYTRPVHVKNDSEQIQTSDAPVT
jgi:hypothetical protein